MSSPTAPTINPPSPSVLNTFDELLDRMITKYRMGYSISVALDGTMTHTFIPAPHLDFDRLLEQIRATARQTVAELAEETGEAPEAQSSPEQVSDPAVSPSL